VVLRPCDKAVVSRLKTVTGFSLVELMFVIAIIGIMGTIMAGEIGSSRYNLRSSVFNMRSLLVRAKSEAVKRNQPVTVSFGAGGYTAAIDPGGPGEVVLFHVDVADKNIDMEIHWLNDRVIFSPRGSAQNGHVLLKNTEGERFVVRTNIAGRVWTEKPCREE
jgi:prepilin-type N-terminal cleavage/methylation domain-containing protein